MRVLFVDDYRETGESLAELAGLLGHDATFACSYDDAVARAIASCPEVMFVDLRLGTDDGRELCRHLRTVPTLAATRYVAVTGLAAPDLECEPGLFDAILTKPVSFDSIERVLGAAADRGKPQPLG